MFARPERLRKTRDIEQVLRRSWRLTSPGLTLRFRHSASHHPRSAVVVGAAVSKLATVRNRVRRQLRHMLRGELRGVGRGVDLMLTARPPLLRQRRSDRLAELRSLLRRAHLG